MNDLYQIRKDIDSLMLAVNRLTSADESTLDIGVLDDNLSVLETNLTSFEKDLDDYVEELEGFESQLEGYSDQLDGFSDQVQGYNTAVRGFSTQVQGYNTAVQGFSQQVGGYTTQVSGFSQQLNGFTGDLDSIGAWIYGKGQTYIDPDTGEEKPCDPNHPSSSSLKGDLRNLHDLIQQMQVGDGIVLNNLGILKDHLNGFSGSLADFKAKLRSQGVDTSVLDDTVTSLILEINKNIYDISDHEKTIGKVETAIGRESDPSQGVTATGIFARLETGEDLIDGVLDDTADLDKTINGDPSVPSDKGLVGLGKDLDKTVNGDPSVPSDKGLVGLGEDLDKTINGDPSDPTDTGLLGLGEDLDKAINGDPSDPTDTGLIGSTTDLIETVNGDPSDPSDTGLVGDTRSLQSTVGKPASGGQSATGLHLSIANAQSSATSANNSATQIKGKIGFDQIGNVTLQQQIVNQNGTISSQGGRISNVEGELSSQDSRITSAEGEISSQGSRVSNAEDKITDIQGDIGTVPSGKTLQGQITTIEDNAPVVITDFFLSDSITGAIQRVNKSLWNVGDNIWILFKLLKNNSTYEPTSTEFPITIFTPSGQSSTIYRYRRIPDGTVSGYLEVYKYTISESGLHLMVLNGKTYPINVDNFSKYTLSTYDTMDYDTNFTTCDVTFSKQNHLVVCTYHINTTTYTNKNDHTLTTSIPSAYRPSSTFYQDICTYGGQKLDGLITVGTNGSMKIRMGTANTSMNVYGSFTYIV